MKGLAIVVPVILLFIIIYALLKHEIHSGHQKIWNYSHLNKEIIIFLNLKYQ